jgi:DNA-binding transcriptional LysR family regulator
MAINFDLNDLQAFRAVVEQGSFRKAADTVRLSQPALSRRIEKLEDALGVKLFERTTRKVSLTQAGRGFMPSVERLLDDLDVALLGISEVASTRLGMSPSLACRRRRTTSCPAWLRAIISNSRGSRSKCSTPAPTMY